MNIQDLEDPGFVRKGQEYCVTSNTIKLWRMGIGKTSDTYDMGNITGVPLHGFQISIKSRKIWPPILPHLDISINSSLALKRIVRSTLTVSDDGCHADLIYDTDFISKQSTGRHQDAR